jgi:hypothetical protein
MERECNSRKGFGVVNWVNSENFAGCTFTKRELRA